MGPLQVQYGLKNVMPLINLQEYSERVLYQNNNSFEKIILGFLGIGEMFVSELQQLSMNLKLSPSAMSTLLQSSSVSILKSFTFIKLSDVTDLLRLLFNVCGTSRHST